MELELLYEMIPREIFNADFEALQSSQLLHGVIMKCDYILHHLRKIGIYSLKYEEIYNHMTLLESTEKNLNFNYFQNQFTLLKCVTKVKFHALYYLSYFASAMTSLKAYFDASARAKSLFIESGIIFLKL